MKFEFIEFNDRRDQRGAPAARVEVTYDDGASEWLWMSKRDISKNMMAFGPCNELAKAHAAYSDPRHAAPARQAQGASTVNGEATPASSEPDGKERPSVHRPDEQGDRA